MINKALRDRLIKNSTLDTTSILSQSLLYNERDTIKTRVPTINVALSGRVDGGLLPGLLQIAGPSKHFKTAFGLLIVTSFLQQYKDGIVIFYDSEFGTPKSYFQSFGINPESVIHCPIMNIEQLKFDLIRQLEDLKATDKVLIFVDSIGGLASKKEIDDTLDQKPVADMSRAKQLKSLFRMLTPPLVLKNIPMVAINHSYKTLDLFSKDVVSGGTGSVYHSNDIWMVGRQQEKDGKDLAGYKFIIKIEKSRTVKEGSKIPITVTFDKGIQRWSGLLDLALESGIVEKVGSKKEPKYRVLNGEGHENWPEYKQEDIEDNGAFWEGLLGEEKSILRSFIEDKYRLANGPVYTTGEETENVN